MPLYRPPCRRCSLLRRSIEQSSVPAKGKPRLGYAILEELCIALAFCVKQDAILVAIKGGAIHMVDVSRGYSRDLRLVFCGTRGHALVLELPLPWPPSTATTNRRYWPGVVHDPMAVAHRIGVVVSDRQV